MSGKSQSEAKGESEKGARKASFRLSSQPNVGSREVEDAHKYEVTQTPVSPAYEELGELPSSYGSGTIYLIARDPQWLFTYWDINWSAYPASAMKDGERKIYLKVFNAGGEESTIQINPDAGNWYIPVERSGEDYRVEVGFYDKDGNWSAVAVSAHATTPAAGIAEDEGAAEFATLPMHLTFQHLLDMVKTAMARGESLLDAVSRLQGEGMKLTFEPGKTPNWTEDQKKVLGALLGAELVERIAMGSGEIDQLLRKQLFEKLNTESASELSIKGRLAELLSVSESSLFSGILGGWSSGVFAGLGGFSSEFAKELSSGIGASWSGQPFGAQTERGFFMHVNAEVIFYGGTHPDAKVTIDGQEIPLRPDGTFRYHFRFPDGDFQIPIVATSPDGAETRTAQLSFKRSTARTGDVGSSAQPTNIPTEPMGRKS